MSVEFRRRGKDSSDLASRDGNIEVLTELGERFMVSRSGR